MVSYLNCTTGKVSHSSRTNVVREPAAIAGVRGCHPPAVWRARRSEQAKQKL